MSLLAEKKVPRSRLPVEHFSPEDHPNAPARRFVATSFSVRRNVVKLWRPLPTGLWTALALPEDIAIAIRRERRAVGGVAVIAVILVAGFSGIGYRPVGAGEDRCFPLLGSSFHVSTVSPPNPGWYYMPTQSLSLVFWTVGSSLIGWAFVRLVWIPCAVEANPRRNATLAFARHLGSVYLYVYLMIVAGVSLMPALIWMSPHGTEMLRWCLWCFLFGESFFVPAAMWMRLVHQDKQGQVFGSTRYLVLTLYVALFAALPVLGMVTELD